MSKSIGALVAAVLAAAPALADDSAAALGAGGIVLTAGTPVRMAQEDLYVSPKAVRIHFVFANDTAKDVQTIVAFPLPDIDAYEFSFSAVGTLGKDPVNFIGFKAVVDGKPVAFEVEQRAFIKNKDVTAQLAAAGAPINTVVEGGYDKLSKLPAATLAKLKKAGLIDDDSGNIAPKWTIRTRFYWTQRFPAHKTVAIDHSYQPVTGGSFFNDQSLTDERNEVAPYCIDAPTRASIIAKSGAARKAKPDNNGYLSSRWTDYILKTANNWNGPIGKFHLTLDKLNPDNIMSLCWAGSLKKTGATTFEFTQSNFAPAEDIHLLVLTDLPTQ